MDLLGRGDIRTLLATCRDMFRFEHMHRDRGVAARVGTGRSRRDGSPRLCRLTGSRHQGENRNSNFHFSTHNGIRRSISPNSGSELLPARPSRNRQVHLAARPAPGCPVSGPARSGAASQSERSTRASSGSSRRLAWEGDRGDRRDPAGPRASHGRPHRPGGALAAALRPHGFECAEANFLELGSTVLSRSESVPTLLRGVEHRPALPVEWLRTRAEACNPFPGADPGGSHRGRT